VGLCLLVVTGCGGGTPAGRSPGDDTPSRLPSSTTPGGLHPGPTADPRSPTRLEGRVQRAGEGSCLHLVVDGLTYELLGATSGLTLGREAVVSGHVDRTVQPQCGSGIPFVVVSVTPPSLGAT
jgi:hypothetical protein